MQMILMHKYIIDIVESSLKRPDCIRATTDGFDIEMDSYLINISKDEMQQIYPHISEDSRIKLISLLLGRHG